MPNKYHFEKYNKEDFNPNDYPFKDHCVICGKKIPADWGHYWVYGNYCKFCTLIAEHNSLNKNYAN